jgi:holo-[acyl-carrier protein] synthase
VGIDTIEIADVEASLLHFGEHYVQRVYTAAERAYAQAAPVMASARLAARFAAKEAAIKALNLSEAGISWRDIEVLRSEDGACHLALHGRAAAIAASRPALQTALSLSHDSTHAVAVLVCLPVARPTADPLTDCLMPEPKGPST